MSMRFAWVVAATAILAVVFAGSGWLLEGIDVQRLPQELVLVAANTLPLLAIRRQPLAVVALFGVTYPTWVALGHPLHELQSLPTVVAMFALGAWDRPLRLRAVGLLLPVWMVAGGTLIWGGDLLELSFVGVFFVVVWTLGVGFADRHAQAVALEARTKELEAARRELAERAVADERARIARELHDVIAHAMSVITVQAGVGAHLIDRRPSQAAESLRTIELTGREALEELRRMLSVLRDPAPHAPVPQPQPRLTDLEELIESARRGGVDAVLVERGASCELSAGLELAVYRVVQEALTNVGKHAPGQAASITVDYDPTHLTVTATNDRAESQEDAGLHEGHGLRGMAERVALYAGELEISADNGCFRVVARFPVARTPR
jgi:signal transduction histidine kinase